MALPQRRDPNEERRIQDLERRRIETSPPATAGGFGWWWLWLLIIIAIIWFAGWGWGGYGGWWWGRRAVAPVAVNGGVNGGVNGAANGVTANGTNGNTAVLPTGEGAAILNAANKAQFVGQNVDIRNVRVNNKVNDRALWIGNNNNGGNNAAGAGANNGTNGATTATNTPVNGATNGAPTAANNNGQNGATNTANAAEIPTLVVLTGATNTKNGNGGNNGNNATANNTVNGNLHSINAGQLVGVIGTVEKAPTAKVAEKEWGLDNDAAKRLERDGAYIRATQVTTASAQQP